MRIVTLNSTFLCAYDFLYGHITIYYFVIASCILATSSYTYDLLISSFGKLKSIIHSLCHYICFAIVPNIRIMIMRPIQNVPAMGLQRRSVKDVIP